MTFLGHHLNTLDYVVWALWIAWALSLGLLVNECCKDMRQRPGRLSAGGEAE